MIFLGTAGLAVRTNTGRLYLIHNIPGDYNNNGTVGPEDYALWKSNLGSTEHPEIDGNGDGTVNAADYTIWRNNRGITMGGPLSLAPTIAAAVQSQPRLVYCYSP